MTKHEAIRQLEGQINPNNPMIASIEAIEMAISALQKEKEPAPSANDASSVISISINDNMTQNQEVISDALRRMFKVYARIYSKNNKGRKQDGKKEEN